MLKLHQKP